MGILVLILLLLALPVRAATYWVATDGDDGNPGSEALPWLTFSWGLSNIAAGDTLKLKAGFYGTGSSSLWETVVNGGTASRITIDGQNVAFINALSITHSNYTVANLGFTNYPYANGKFMCELGMGAHRSIISNCVVDVYTNYYTRGIGIVSQEIWPWDTNCPSDCQIIDNEIIGGTKICIGVNGFRNLIQSNFIHDVWITEAVVQIYGGSHVIRANTISNILSTEGLSGHVDCFETTGNTIYSTNGWIKGTTNILVERNWVEYLDGQPVSIVDYGHPDYLYGFVFRNNVFIRTTEAAQNTITHSVFYNNTFYHCSEKSDGFAMAWSVSRLDDDDPPWSTNEYGHSGRCFNNLFLNCGNLTNSTINAGWYSFMYTNPTWPEAELPLTNCAADYNWVCKITNDVPYGAVAVGTVAVGDGNAWDVQEFFETNGINGGNPYVQDETNYNFRLKSISPLIGSGADLSAWEPSWATFTNDFDGNPRDNTRPSIGAFEYNPSSNLLVHFNFADDYTNNGYVTDQSGNSHHAWFYDATNLPGRVDGPTEIGGYAWFGYTNGWTVPDTYVNGQYAAITNLNGIDKITNGTLAVWVQFAANAQRYDTIFDCGYPLLYIGTNELTSNSWSWMLGHPETDIAATTMTFQVHYETGGDNTDTNGIIARWPGQIRDGATWRHIALTFSADSDEAVAYQDGVALATNEFVFPYIRVYATNTPPPQWIALGAHQHTGDPEPWWEAEGQPNTGFFKGKMADLRIYDAVLSAADIADLAGVGDGEAPPATNTLQKVTLRGARVTTRGKVTFR